MFFLYLHYLNVLFIFYQLGYKLTQIAPETMFYHLHFKEVAADHTSTEGAKVEQLKLRYLNVPSSKALLHNFLTATFPLCLKMHFWGYLSLLSSLLPVSKGVLTNEHQRDISLDLPQ